MKKAILLTGVLICLYACGSRYGKKDSTGDAGRLQYAPEVNEVEVITLQRQDFPLQLTSNGKIRAAARTSIQFAQQGAIASIHVKNGQMVAAGTVLATLDRPDLKMALDASEIAFQRAQLDLYDYLVGQGYPARDTSSVPDDILEKAKLLSGFSSARNHLQQARYEWNGTTLKAPHRGRVAHLTTGVGEMVGGNPFCTLLDDSSFEVEFPILESEYAFLQEGVSVEVTPYANDAMCYRGKISGINPSVDKNGQIQVRARIKGDSLLLDGMNVKVQVERALPGQLVVPRSAVVIRDNLDVLFTYTDDGKAHWKYVTIVASNGTSHAVKANSSRGATLEEGERVIISGNLNLADGSETVLHQ